MTCCGTRKNLRAYALLDFPTVATPGYRSAPLAVAKNSSRCTPAQIFRPLRPNSSPFIRHGWRSKNLPNEPRSSTSLSDGRAAQTSPKTKKEYPTNGGVFFLVAGMGFEPHDLRVMSPTSYRTALPRDILLPLNEDA